MHGGALEFYPPRRNLHCIDEGKEQGLDGLLAARATFASVAFNLIYVDEVNVDVA